MFRSFSVTISCRKCFSTTNRYYSENGPEVRVRFAPSPTGQLHLGGLRTAFYNYIYAKKNGGKFILRIEDTDQSRVVKGSEEEIEELLTWSGLKPDESPTKGGQYGPYVQSARLHLYQQKAAELIESGRAYRCFCSPDRLSLLRNYQSRNREKPHYDRKCHNLSQAEIEEKLRENNGRHVVRFALSDGLTQLDDMIFGQINNNLRQSMESDPIILKSDLFPTYHFANVIDDHYMRISHVLRGSEWISSTAKHIQLYGAFGWNTPVFAHFPLITMQDGSKMSKRNNQSHVSQLRHAGFRPLAILNLLTNMGGGVPKTKQDSLDLWEMERIVEGFDFGSVACHPGSVNKSRLDIYNSKDLRKTLEHNPEELRIEIRRLLNQRGITTEASDNLIDVALSRNIDRIVTLNDLMSPENIYIWQQPEFTCSLQEYHDKGIDIKGIVEHVIELVKCNKIEDKSALREVAIKHGIEWPLLMKFIRTILTNREEGLPVYDIFKCLGDDRLLEYLNKFLKLPSL